jgi:hypothetical protein
MTAQDPVHDTVSEAERIHLGNRARELFERGKQTNLDLGRAGPRFIPTFKPRNGRWDIAMAILGAAIIAAIVIVNLI